LSADTPQAPDVAAAGAQAPETASPVATPAVGSLLRAAREAAQLTQDDLAQAIKFSPRQIAALEADDYAALPGATIVRGFVRSYARHLKLDADALLSQLDAALPTQPVDVRPPENMGIASEPRGLSELSPLRAVALVIALAAGLLVLWHFFGPTQQMASPSPTQASLPSVPTAPSVVMPPMPTVSAGNAVPPAPTAAVPLPADALAAGSAAPQLRFEFADRSWVEVQDGRGQTLFSGEKTGGSELLLGGQPPFEIVIGNAGQVRLVYDGRPIDLLPHTRAEVARLTLE